MYRIFLWVAALSILAGCGGDLGGSPSNQPGGGLSADNVVVTVEKGTSSNGTPLFNVSFTNGTGQDISASADFRLLSGTTVVEDGTAFSTDNLRSGQTSADEVRFFDIESHNAYECYEYDLQIFAVGASGSDSKTYSTCP